MTVHHRPRARLNLLDRVADPAGRRWRVVEVNGIGFARLNDPEIHVALPNGAILHVTQHGDVRLEKGSFVPVAGQTASVDVTVTVEADDGPVRMTYETNGAPWVRGPGTRLTQTFPVQMKGFSAWTPASLAPAFWLDPTTLAQFTPPNNLNGEATAEQGAKSFRFIKSLADRAGGATTAATTGLVDTAVSNHHRACPRLWKRHEPAADPYVLFREPTYRAHGANDAAVAVASLTLAPAVSARTILAVLAHHGSSAEYGTPMSFLTETAGAAIQGTDGSPHLALTTDVADWHADGRALGTGLAAPNGRVRCKAEAAVVAITCANAHLWDRLLGSGRWIVQELVLVAGALSQADVDRWMGYAAHRHDLAWKLPWSHPYRWGPPGFETPAAEPTPTPAAVAFGRFTQAGAGGVPVAWLGGAKTIASGDPSGHWQILEGALCPTAAFAAAVPAAGTVYTLTLSNGDAIAVTLTEAEAHVARDADVSAAANLATKPSGQDFFVTYRPGRYGSLGGSGSPPGGGAALVFRAEKRRRARGSASSTFTALRLRVEGLAIDRRSGPWDRLRPAVIGAYATSAGGSATVRDCEVVGDWLDPTWNYYTRFHNYQSDGSIDVAANVDAVIEDCEFRFLNALGACKGARRSIYRRNTVRSRFGDGISMRPSSDGGNLYVLPDGETLWERYFHENVDVDSLGINNYYGDPHCDWSQVRFASSDAGLVYADFQRSFYWQSEGNRDHLNAYRQAARGAYLENDPVNGDKMFVGRLHACVLPSRMDEPVSLSAATMAVKVSDCHHAGLTPSGPGSWAGVGYQGERQVIRNKVGYTGESGLYPDEARLTGGVVVIDQVAGALTPGVLWADPTWAGFETPADWVAKLTPVAGGPLDLGGDALGAVTPGGALKPLKTKHMPLRPAPPTLAFKANGDVVVTFPANPPDPWAEANPILRRDLAWWTGPSFAAQKGVTDAERDMARWTYIPGAVTAAGQTYTIPAALLPGDASIFVRARVVTDQGIGPWSKAGRSAVVEAGCGLWIELQNEGGTAGTQVYDWQVSRNAGFSPVEHSGQVTLDAAGWLAPAGVGGVAAGTWYARSRKGTGTWRTVTPNGRTPAGPPAPMQPPQAMVYGSDVTVSRLDVARVNPAYTGVSGFAHASLTYDLRWRRDGGAWTEVPGVGPTTTLTGMTPGAYEIQIAAVNTPHGRGSWSNAASCVVRASYWQPTDEASVWGWWDVSNVASGVSGYGAGGATAIVFNDLSGKGRNATRIAGQGWYGTINGRRSMSQSFNPTRYGTGVLALPDALAVVGVFLFTGTLYDRAASVLSVGASSVWQAIRATNAWNLSPNDFAGFLDGNGGQTMDNPDPDVVPVTLGGKNGVPVVYTLRYEPGHSYAWRDGAVADAHHAVRAANQLGGLSGQLLLFGRLGANSTPGHFGEAIALATTDLAAIQKAEAYIAHKWGVRLDPDHPYYTGPA